VDNHKALVADFGLSQTIDGVRTRSGNTSQQGPRGTLRWMAPECIDGGSPTKASDIYSLGITIWEAYSEEVPFARYNERIFPYQVVGKQERPPRPQRMEANAIWDLVQCCWMPEATARPTIDLVQRSLQPLSTRLRSPDLNPALSRRPSSSQETRVNTAPATISAPRLEKRWPHLPRFLTSSRKKHGSPSVSADESVPLSRASAMRRSVTPPSIISIPVTPPSIMSVPVTPPPASVRRYT